MDEKTPQEQARTGTNRGLMAAGFASLALAVAGIVCFVVRSALAGFPLETITTGRNWILIGCHVFLGIVGLILLDFSRRR